MKRLEQWSLVHVRRGGVVTTHAAGVVYGDPRCGDGTETITTEIAERLYKTRQLVTRSGSVYQLGAPHEAYLKAMRGRDAKTDQLLGIGPQEPEAAP